MIKFFTLKQEQKLSQEQGNKKKPKAAQIRVQKGFFFFLYFIYKTFNFFFKFTFILNILFYYIFFNFIFNFFFFFEY